MVGQVQLAVRVPLPAIGRGYCRGPYSGSVTCLDRCSPLAYGMHRWKRGGVSKCCARMSPQRVTVVRLGVTTTMGRASMRSTGGPGEPRAIPQTAR